MEPKYLFLFIAIVSFILAVGGIQTPALGTICVVMAVFYSSMEVYWKNNIMMDELNKKGYKGSSNFNRIFNWFTKEHQLRVVVATNFHMDKDGFTKYEYYIEDTENLEMLEQDEIYADNYFTACACITQQALMYIE